MSFGRNSKSFVSKQNQNKSLNKIENSLEEILNKNNLVANQLESLLKNNSTSQKDIEHYENLLKELENEINTVESNLPTIDESLFEKYNKFLKREKETIKSNKKRFNELKANYNNSNLDYREHFLSTNNNASKQELEQYKVNVKDIKLMQDVSQYREEKLKNINEKIYLLDKYSKDMQFLTQKSDNQVNTLVDNVVTTLEHHTEAHKILIKTDKEEKSLKDNKCCIILLIVVTLLFLLLIFINSK